MQHPCEQQGLSLWLTFATLRPVQNRRFALAAGHRWHQCVEAALMRLKRIDVPGVQRKTNLDSAAESQYPQRPRPNQIQNTDSE